MATHRRPRQPGRARATVFTAAAAAAVALTAGAAAQAAPGAPAAPSRPAERPAEQPPERPAEQDVKRQVDQLYTQAEAATERYNGARESLRRLRSESAALQGQVARGRDALNRMLADLSQVAGAQYRSGGLDPTVQLMLSSDPAGYLDRATALDRVSVRQAEMLHEVATRQRALDQRRAEAGAKLAELERVRLALAHDKQTVQQRLGRARALLSTLSAEQRARLAADDARAAHERATRGTGRIDLGDVPAPDGRAATAVAAATGALGSPYFYGATGPRAFDCSGLMYWAWSQAGVTLPRTSQGQAFAGRRVSLADARPGDLVIYYGDMHHVGMYVGGGTIIHAPYPGARVRYESARAMPIAAVVRV
ncbi:NlpC/P60 family protein [Peterkaempfera bronchialis]|uniref:C40 family peptidase n=1 Tax=Peterkaempfera bronchialis TaxID=2126346 RepID=UPI003C2AFFC3